MYGPYTMAVLFLYMIYFDYTNKKVILLATRTCPLLIASQNI